MEMPECAKCGSKMHQGFVLDRGHGGVGSPACWIAGEPESSFWTGTKYKSKPQYEVQTFRCIKCGYLESYAPND